MNISRQDYVSIVTERIAQLTEQLEFEGLDQCLVELLSDCLAHCHISLFTGTSRGIDSLAGILASNAPDQKLRGDHVFKLGPTRVARKLVIDGNISPVRMRVIRLLLRVYGNQLKHLKRSTYDNLTNLLNREAFDQIFVQGNQSQKEERRHLMEKSAMALVDVDHFKKVNDHYGHMIGDEVLLLVAQVMRSALRKSDLVFRLGGEEFVIVLGSVSREKAMEVLEKVREKIGEHVFPQVGQVTVSMGYSLLGRTGTSDLYLNRSDAALYYAKKNGRNQVCCYEQLREEGLINAVEAREGAVELFNIQKRLI